MQDSMLLLSGFAGGLFLGYIASIFAGVVWIVCKEWLSAPLGLAIPSIVLLSIFGIGLLYLALEVFKSWPLLFGAALTFTYNVRSIIESK